MERFRREVATVANLRSSSMIAVYELGEHDGQPFAAMQHLGEDNLRRAIKTRRSLTLLRKMLIMRQVGEGVQAAHRGGLSHVGIRPSGIALDADGRVTIQDFGAVRLPGEEQEEGVSYSAPEESAPGFSPDPLCDIFAFGAIYYELLTGTHPFDGDVLKREPAPLRKLAPDCPEELERLVHRALHKDRELRYQHLDDLQYDAEPVLGDLKRSRAAGLLTDARRLADAQEADQAQNILREILELEPDNRQAQRLRNELRGVAQRRTRQLRLEALWREAEEEAAGRRFERAVEILESSLRLDAANPDANRRLEQMRLRLDRSRRAAALVAEARQSLDEAELAQAQRRASEALETDPESREAAELLHAIADVIKRREREARIERSLAEAQSLLLAQSFEAAISILAGLEAECPESPLVERWLAEARARQVQAERQTRLRVQLGVVQSLLAQRKFAAAVEIIEPLRAEFPGEEQVSILVVRAREAMERASAIDRAVARCNQFRREEQFEKACEVLEAALAGFPGEPALLSMRREVEVQWQEHKTAAAVRQVLDEVQWLLEQDRPDLAIRALTENIARLPYHQSLTERLASLEALLPSWEQRRFIQDCLSRAGALEEVEQWPVALTVLEEALQACPASGELLQAAERVRGRLREEERRKKLARRLEAIRQKIAAQAWSQALSLIESAQAEFPGEPELTSLLEDVQRGLRCAQCESVLAEVRQLVADSEMRQAQDTLQKALESLGDEPALEALREELEADKQYREEWRTAQVLFGRRQFKEAEQILARLTAPNRPEVQILLNTVRQARAANEEEDFYNRSREEAVRLIQQEQFEQAAELLRNLLSLFPGDPILERALQSMRNGRGQEQPEGAVSVRDSVAAAPAPSAEPVFSAAAPRGIRWSRICAAVVLLVAAGAAVWSWRRDQPLNPPPVSKPSAMQTPIPRRTPGEVASLPVEVAASPVTAPAAPAKIVSEKPGPQTRPAPSPVHRPFSLPAPSNANAGRLEAPVIPPPPAAVPVAPSGAPAPLANVIKPAGAPAPPPPPAVTNTPPSAEQAPQPPRGGNFQEPKAISRPSPKMPPVAKQLGIRGVVNLQTTIDKSGTVTNVAVLSGHPVLAQAAKDAVRNWRFQPATLNGQPIEVKIGIRVAFEGDRE